MRIWPFKRTERRSAYDTLVQLFGWGDGASRSRTYAALSKDYAECGVVRAGLDMIAEGLAALRYPIAVDGTALEEGDTIPANLAPLDALLRRPNDNQAFAEFIAKWTVHLYCGGQTYTYGINIGNQTLGDLVRARTGAELYLLRPDKVRCIHKDRRVDHYEYTDEQGRTQTFKAEEVVTHRFPHPDDDFSGLSPLAAVRNEIDSLIEAGKWQVNLLKNLAVPAGLISLKNWNQIDQPERDRLRQEWDTKFKGAQNQGKTFFSGAEANYQSLATSPKELDWINSDAAQMRKVCAAIRVPSVLLGDPAQSTYANYEEARKAWFEQTVIPLANKWVGEVNHRFIVRYGENVELQVDASHIECLKENENDIYQRHNGVDFESINDSRLACGLDEVDDPEASIPRGLRKVAYPDPFAEPGSDPDEEPVVDEPPPDKEKDKEGRSMTIPFRVASTRHTKHAAAR